MALDTCADEVETWKGGLGKGGRFGMCVMSVLDTSTSEPERLLAGVGGGVQQGVCSTGIDLGASNAFAHLG